MSRETTIVYDKSEPMRDQREEYNKRLKEKFGIDTLSNLPIWRVAWAPSQYAKQLGTFEDYTEGGIYLRTVTEVREIPKYAHLGDLYIIEMLMVIPKVNEKDLPAGNLSYECMHPYMHAVNQTYLPLNWEFTEWVIDCYYAGIGNKSLRKYVADDGTEVDKNLKGMEAKRKRIAHITQYLYGNETAVSDALAYGSGVALDSTKQFGNPEQK